MRLVSDWMFRFSLRISTNNVNFKNRTVELEGPDTSLELRYGIHTMSLVPTSYLSFRDLKNALLT